MNGSVALLTELWVQRLGWVLIHFLWQAAGIALLLAVVLRLLARASSHVRYVMIGSAFLLCAVLPVATWIILGPQASSSMTSTAVLNPMAVPQVELPVIRDSAPLTDSIMATPGHVQTRWQDNLRWVTDASLPYVVGLWFGGILILTLRLTMGWMLMRRICLSGIPIRDAICVERFRVLLDRMQVVVPVRLLESALIEVPTLIGWLRPTILVPASVFIGLSPDQLEAILAHELAHVRRYDYLVNLLQTVIETILFYHPAVWWISHKLREERENCCDDIALEVMHDRLVYASALAQLEEARALPLALTASGGSLLQRIRRIVGANDRKVSAWPLWILIIGILFIFCLSKSKAIEPATTANASMTWAGDAEAEQKGVAALVNHKPLLWTDIASDLILSEQYQRAKQTGNKLLLKYVVQEAIDSELVIQEAEASGYCVPQRDLDERVNYGVKGFGGNKDAFVENLKENGSSLEQFTEQNRRFEIYTHMVILNVDGPTKTYLHDHPPATAAGASPEAAKKAENALFQKVSTKLENDWMAGLRAKAVIRTFADSVTDSTFGQPAPPSSANGIDEAADNSSRFIRVNGVHHPAWKVTDMLLSDLVRQLTTIFRENDPQKQGIDIKLKLPEGEPAIHVSFDFKADTTLLYVLLQLQENYPVHFKNTDDEVEITQLSQSEAVFDRKAKEIKIGLDFDHAEASKALAAIQSAAAVKGFIFSLEGLDALKVHTYDPANTVTFKAEAVSVDQAIRTICYLGDLDAVPLEKLTGYKVAFEPNKTTAVAITGDAVNLRVKVLKNEEGKIHLQLKSYFDGPASYPHDTAGNSVIAVFTDGDNSSSQTPPRLTLTYTYKLLDKSNVQINGTVELKDLQGATVDKVSGQWKQRLNTQVRLMVHNGPTVTVPSVPSDVTNAPVGSEINNGYFFYVTVDGLEVPGGAPVLPPLAKNQTVDVELTNTAGSAAKDPATKTTDASPVPKESTLTRVLVAAVKQGDVAEVDRLLKQGADPNANQSPDGNNALFVAAENNQVEVLKLLLKNGADPNCANSCGNAPIDWTLSRGNLEVATVLHDAGAKISPEGWAAATDDLVTLRVLANSGVLKKGKTDGAMHYATSMGQLEAVKFLESIEGKPVAGKFLSQAARSGNIPMLDYILSRGANMKTDGGDAMDQAIIFFNQPESVKWLLAHGVDPNHVSKWNEFSLAECKSAAMVKILLDAGANPNGQGDGNDDIGAPLVHAPDAESVRLLVQHGANLKPKFKDGYTLIDIVTSRNSNDKAEVVAELIKEGAEFDPKGNGATALARAAAWNHIDTMQVLLDHGVSPSAYSDEPFMHCSALNNAANEPSPEAVKFLLDHGADPNGDPRDTNTPLGYAVMCGRKENAELLRKAGAHDVGDLSAAAALGDLTKVSELLKNGANIDETDHAGNTPLYYSVRRGHPDVARLLIQNGANVNPFNLWGQTAQGEFEFELAIQGPNRNEMDWGVPEDEGNRRRAIFKELFAKYPLNPSYQDSHGRTALHQSAFAGNSELNPLRDYPHPACLNLLDNDGNTPLILAALSPQASELATKISVSDPKHPDKSMKDWNGAAYIADRLIQAGAKLDLKMPNGQTQGEVAMAAAVKARNPQLISVLHDAGIATNFPAPNPADATNSFGVPANAQTTVTAAK